MNEILEKILGDICDEDISEYLLSDSSQADPNKTFLKESGIEFVCYKNWELIDDPIKTAFMWQTLRNEKRGKILFDHLL